LVRQYIPFADKLINKIAESSPVQALMKPLEQPVKSVGGMIDQVSEKAVGMVEDSEQKAATTLGSGAKLLTGIAGVTIGAKAASNKAEGKKGEGGDFLGSIKGGIHTRLLAFGQKLLQSGKALLMKGVDKVKGLVSGLMVRFKIGSEDHKLWVEKRSTQNVVMMASKPDDIREKIEEFERQLPNISENEQGIIVSKIEKLKDIVTKLEKNEAQADLNVAMELVSEIFSILTGVSKVEIRNWKGEVVKIPEGHTMSPRDPDFSKPPIYREGPFTTTQRDQFLKGNSANTKLAPHHRHQIPVRDGGVIDELPGPGHPEGNMHTGGSPSRHPGKSIFNSEPGGNMLRQTEIEDYWTSKGKRLVESERGTWYDSGYN
ncbi:MAG: hypothetical protein K0R84_2807, partial [Clostridia bacterium]|nr:hypothetical protein [Clostridia bacterium]